MSPGGAPTRQADLGRWCWCCRRRPRQRRPGASCCRQVEHDVLVKPVMALTIRPPEHRRLAALKRAARIRRWPKPDVERLFDLDDLRARSYLARRMVSDAVLVEGEGDRGRERRCAVVTQSPAFQPPVWQVHETIVTDTFATVDALVRITSFPNWLNCVASAPSDGTETTPACRKAVVDELVGRRPSRETPIDRQAVITAIGTIKQSFPCCPPSIGRTVHRSASPHARREPNQRPCSSLRALSVAGASRLGALLPIPARIANSPGYRRSNSCPLFIGNRRTALPGRNPFPAHAVRHRRAPGGVPQVRAHVIRRRWRGVIGV